MIVNQLSHLMSAATTSCRKSDNDDDDDELRDYLTLSVGVLSLALQLYVRRKLIKKKLQDWFVRWVKTISKDDHVLQLFSIYSLREKLRPGGGQVAGSQEPQDVEAQQGGVRNSATPPPLLPPSTFQLWMFWGISSVIFIKKIKSSTVKHPWNILSVNSDHYCWVVDCLWCGCETSEHEKVKIKLQSSQWIKISLHFQHFIKMFIILSETVCVVQRHCTIRLVCWVRRMLLTDCCWG